MSGLHELGYVEGKNIVIEWRSAEVTRDLGHTTVALRNPMRGFSLAAVRRLTLQYPAVSVQPRLMTNQPCSLRASFVRRIITDTEAEKSVITEQQNQIYRGEKANFDVGLN